MLSPREYFAGQALNAMLRSSYDCNCSGYEFKNIVAGAREYADDLVNELRKTSEQGESPATAGNSDYAAALRVFNQYHDSIDSCDMSFLNFCEQRLNSAKAPNCA